MLWKQCELLAVLGLGNRRPPRYADYILYHGVIAIIGAKEEDEDHLKGMKQAKDYCNKKAVMEGALWRDVEPFLFVQEIDSLSTI